MLVRLLLAVLAILFAIPAQAADFPSDDQVAYLKPGVISPAVRCGLRLAWLANDGCLGAPTYNPALTGMQYQNQSMLVDGTLLQTPGYRPGDNANVFANLTRINWNVAGRDFAVGANYRVYCNGTTIPCSTTPGTGQGWSAAHPNWGVLVDMMQYDYTTDPAKFCNNGWSSVTNYAAAGDGSYAASKFVRCKIKDVTNAGDVAANLQGMDLTPGGQCVSMNLQDSATQAGSNGTIIFSNNRFVLVGSNGLVPAACSDQRYNPNAIAGLAYQYNLSTAGHLWSFFVENNFLDPQVSLNRYSSGTGIINVQSVGSVTFRYNYLGDNNGRVFAALVCGSIDASYNFSPSLGSQPSDPHGEMLLAQINDNLADVTRPQCYDGTSIKMASLRKVNNVLVSKYNRNGSEISAALAFSVAPANTTTPPKPIVLAALEVGLNILVSNYIKPGQLYVLADNSIVSSYPPSGSIVLNSSVPRTITGTYSQGDVLRVKMESGATGSCETNPTIKIYSPTGTAANSMLAVAWDGGLCSNPPAIPSSGFDTECVSCADPTASGLGVSFTGGQTRGWSNKDSAMYLSAAKGSLTTHSSVSWYSNALLSIGAISTYNVALTSGGTMCYGALDQKGAPDFELSGSFTNTIDWPPFVMTHC